MSYIGRQLNNLSDRVKLDSITASATATYNLLLNTVAYVPSSAESLTVSLNGVIQAPQDSYTVSGSTITFASTLSASDSIDFILAERSITLTSVSAGSVGTTQLAADAVNGDKIADDSISDEHLDITAITGQTEKTSLADADKFLISDSAASGALKYVQKSNLPSGTHVLVASSVEASTDVSAITLDGHVDHSLYSFYKFYARMEFTVNNFTLNFRFRNSGSSITGSNYNHTAFGKKNTAGTLADTTQVNWGGGETNLATNVSYAYPSFITGELYHDVSGGIGNYSMMKGLHAIPRWNGAANEQRIMNFHVIYDNGSQSTDGFTFYPSTGNFDRHEIYVYGVKK